MLQLFKQCSICLQEKPSSEYNAARSTRDRLTSYCKSCKNDYSNRRYKEKPEVAIKIRAWQKENSDRFKESVRKSRAVPINRVRANLRKGLEKHSKLKSDIGTSTEKLKSWLESQFTSEMTWENYGKVWAVYRLKQMFEFDLMNPEEVMKINHFTNLQPRIIAEEVKKNGKLNRKTEPTDL